MRRLLPVLCALVLLGPSIGASSFRTSWRLPPTPTYVQSCDFTSNNADSASCTLSGVTAGSTLVACAYDITGGSTMTVADGSSTYNSYQPQALGVGVTPRIFVALNVAGGSMTVTATSTGEFPAMGVAEYSGAATFDTSVSNKGTFSTADSGSANAAANGTAVGCLYTHGGTPGAGTGWTGRQALAATAAYPGQIIDRAISASSSYNATSSNSSNEWYAGAVFLSTSGGGGGSSFIPGIINNPTRGGGRR